jgi:hypothetical protein
MEPQNSKNTDTETLKHLVTTFNQSQSLLLQQLSPLRSKKEDYASTTQYLAMSKS